LDIPPTISPSLHQAAVQHTSTFTKIMVFLFFFIAWLLSVATPAPLIERMWCGPQLAPHPFFFPGGEGLLLQNWKSLYQNNGNYYGLELRSSSHEA
jgi:hypothetical protein